MKQAFEKHISLLGHIAKDKATGMKGVVVSVSFDLNGCIQAVLQPTVNKDGKLDDGKWMDVKRLVIVGKQVMTPPNFSEGYQAEGNQGASEKPIKH